MRLTIDTYHTVFFFSDKGGRQLAIVQLVCTWDNILSVANPQSVQVRLTNVPRGRHGQSGCQPGWGVNKMRANDHLINRVRPEYQGKAMVGGVWGHDSEPALWGKWKDKFKKKVQDLSAQDVSLASASTRDHRSALTYLLKEQSN